VLAMPLKERIYKDMVEAMKNKDNFKKNILSMVRAAILQVEKDTQKELDDEGVIKCCRITRKVEGKT